MRIDVLTTFPEMFVGPLDHSIAARARSSGAVDLRIHNLRDWSDDPHRKTDDEQYGGGDGMVMKAPPILSAARDLAAQTEQDTRYVVLSPQGRLFGQEIAEELAACEHLVLICGHYKGIDERVMEILRADEISIGDYVLSGGEIPAMALIDAVIRLIPGVVGSMDSVLEDSFTSGLLDSPRYTRPQVVEDRSVPQVLLNGNHREIQAWRLEQAKRRTAERRPDLYRRYCEREEQHKRKTG
ncbi:MAG TPA: tRNA (guanosine(37)-N1)-methyltransferase TrmD [bacterium]|nr:tRNA (guanosine(37)-N1)-methyltransferase TrmD [bacterium]HPO08326.1 tRNA (guanosine(37)-N1)-methyltransferase TrmD [bacterium]HQO37006.1 tRNA (guanosine(37)-N1)-methyltransferase TrmD [bacterium]HQP99384.1 tRNA (guanosine(37)-N1)-methyltransferase TrmD [bacterium]